MAAFPSSFRGMAGLILLVFLACTAKPGTPTERIEYFENGQVSSRIGLVNGKREGKMTEYYPDGSLRGERWFRDDKQHGRTVWYYPKGQIKEVQYFADGAKHGGDTVWYEDGTFKFILGFEQGKKQGELQSWDSTGHLVFHARYRADTLVEVKGEKIRPAYTKAPGIDSSVVQ